MKVRRMSEWWSRLRGRDELVDLDNEAGFHIEMQAQQYVARGMSPAEARRAAAAQFGSVDRWREELRDNDPLHAFSDFGRDVRVGLRALRKTPVASFSAIVALTLGIGLITLMFSIVYAVVLRGLPFEDADRLMHIAHARMVHGENEPPTLHEFNDWRGEQRSFESLAAFRRAPVTLRFADHPERHEGALVTAGLFKLLRVRPILGRSIAPADDQPGAPLVVLISHSVWQNRFAGDPAIVGRTIQAEGEPATIVGVMPERFGFPSAQHVWLPLRLDPARIERASSPTIRIAGRLARGIEIGQAQSELSHIARRFAAAYPDPDRDAADAGVNVRPLIEAFLPPRVTSLLYTMLGAVLLVLLIACANVANILIGRGVLRAREIGVRTALGASRFRVIRQFLTESTILAASGALLGAVVAVVGMRLFMNAIAATSPPFWIDIRLHGGVMAFVLAITIVASLLAGAIPAWQAARADVNVVLKDDTRGTTSFKLGRLSRALVVFEIALSVGLLYCAGLTIRSVINLQTIDVGFATNDVFVGRVSLPERDYPDAAARRRFFAELMPRLNERSGAAAVAITSGVPGLSADGTSYALEGRTYQSDRDYEWAQLAHTTPELLATVDLQPVQGRMLTTADAHGREPVVLVSAALARREFPNGNAIGARLRLAPGGDEPWRTIVGVVPELYLAGLSRPDLPAIIAPLDQGDAADVGIIARANGNPLDLAPHLRAAVAAVDPNVAIYEVNTLRAALDNEGWIYWIFGTMFMVFGGAALLLAAIGLYGVMATAVRQRTREIGVRMALGATRGAVLRLVLGQGMIQLAIGVMAGLGFAFLLARLLSSILFRVAPNDPVTFIAITGLMSVTAMLATLLPAARASAVHPIESLRHD